MTTITTTPPRRVVQLGLGGNVALLIAIIAAVYLISGPLITLLLAAFRGPLDRLMFESETYWTLSNFAAVYLSPRLYSNIIPSTAKFVAGSVTLTFFVAFTLAWLVERTDLPLRTTVFTCVLFPLLVPTVVLGLAWTFLLGPRAGLVNVAIRAIFGWQGDGPIQLFSMGGLIFCQGLALVPFVFLLLGAALRSMNPSLEEASAASGASPFTTFFHVTLRVLLPGIPVTIHDIRVATGVRVPPGATHRSSSHPRSCRRRSMPAPDRTASGPPRCTRRPRATPRPQSVPRPGTGGSARP